MTAAPMLPLEDLDRIAQVTAKRAGAGIAADVYGATWERFIRYKPRTRAGAWRMASSARNDVYRREAYQEKIRRVSIEESYEVGIVEHLDGEIATAAQGELMAELEAADPAGLAAIRTHVSGRRKLPPAELERIRGELLVSLKARSNGRFDILKARAFI